MSRDIPLESIKPDPDQPRKHFDPESIRELAQSIEANGLAVPILLRPNGNGFIIVHGERRYRAIKSLNWETIPAEVKNMSPEEAFILALIENVQRDDLSPTEEARAFVRLRDTRGMSQADIGKLVGKSQQFVASRLSLLTLSDDVQQMITTRVVSPSIGVRIAAIKDPKIQKSLANSAAKDNLTVKDIEKAKHSWTIKQAKSKSEFEKLLLMADEEPGLLQYEEAVKKEEIRVSQFGVVYWEGIWNEPPLKLHVKDVTKNFSGQNFNWPKYSGTRYSTLSENEVGKYPLFSEDEWLEWLCFDEKNAFEDFTFPLSEYFSNWPSDKKDLMEHPLFCRDYDHSYGRFIANNKLEFKRTDSTFFVRQGWGSWQLVEFNDGEGGRAKRRYFKPDFVTQSLISEAMKTVDPYAFSHYNFNRLSIWQAQKYEASWFYWRRETISREDAIAALEKDLELLRATPELSEEEFTERVLDFLQDFTPNESHLWREGYCTTPRNPDGTINNELIKQIWGV